MDRAPPDLGRFNPRALDLSAMHHIEAATSADIPEELQMAESGRPLAVRLPSHTVHVAFKAFHWVQTIVLLELPLGVTRIGHRAFSSCSRLQSVEIPSTVVKIDASAFAGCASLRSIELPEGLQEIASATFRWCHRLSRIKIPDSVGSIGVSAFEGCSSLTFIDLPPITTVSRLMLARCLSLRALILPEEVTTMHIDALAHTTALEVLVIPPSVIHLIGLRGTPCDLNIIVAPQFIVDTPSLLGVASSQHIQVYTPQAKWAALETLCWSPKKHKQSTPEQQERVVTILLIAGRLRANGQDVLPTEMWMAVLGHWKQWC